MPGRHTAQDAKDAVAGDIFWLRQRPRKEGVQATEPKRDIFDHPVLILSLQADGLIACVLIVSRSFSIRSGRC